MAGARATAGPECAMTYPISAMDTATAMMSIATTNSGPNSVLSTWRKCLGDTNKNARLSAVARDAATFLVSRKTTTERATTAAATAIVGKVALLRYAF